MYKGKTITVYMPCRNEAQNLKRVISKIPTYVDEIIVVSNRSTDNTVKVARKLGAKVVEDNRALHGIGYGYAHITGIREASSDIIVSCDSDDQHPIEEIGNVLDHLFNHEIDFISCSRYGAQKKQIPVVLRFGVGILNLETKLLYGIKLHDVLSGMWVFRKDIRDDLQLSCGDWNLSPQIKINAAKNPSINFQEYEIAQRRREGKSHQYHVKSGFAHASWILKNRIKIASQTSDLHADAS